MSDFTTKAVCALLSAWVGPTNYYNTYKSCAGESAKTDKRLLPGDLGDGMAGQAGQTYEDSYNKNMSPK